MGESSTRNEEAIFDVAIQMADRTERDAYVTAVCAGDEELRTSVLALLRYHDSGSFLDTPAIETDISPGESAPVEGPGTVIGRYKLLERIGEGGMAVVYMAEQTQPIRRKVALKIIKLGMDTRQVIARFEAERQALAMMEHPNIARVFDAGATETGRPYFVMELVTGVSITAYCDQNQLSTTDRLDLFIQVCHALQHAHQKGIIHRDIKPSNVMVTVQGGKPVPKVIDFGIAKATNQKLTEKTLFTRYAHIIGTPAYMSPEQAELSDLDIDTRSDIYSLGVLLYELLTGTKPFGDEELRKAGYLEIQRVIREKEPTKPSTKLTMLGETLVDVARCRRASPDTLTRTIRGDLDWIVMKSLEKDRARRYETPSALGSDIQRYLDNEPVVARGPSVAYRLQKFLRRRRAEITVTMVFFVLLGVALAGLSMWSRDRQELREAEAFRHKNLLSNARELYGKGRLQEALEHVESILDSDHVGSAAQLLYAGLLVEGQHPDEAVVTLERLLDDRPEIAGAAYSLLARVQWEAPVLDAGKLDRIEASRAKAETLLEETAEAYFLRAMTAFTIRGKLDLLDKALRVDPGHYESRRLRAQIYQASRRYRDLEVDALVMTALKPPEALGYSLCAFALSRLGRYEEALAYYDSALALTPEQDSRYVELNGQRCDVLMRMGEYERVITEAQKCLESVPNAAVLLCQVGCALTALGRYEEAVNLARNIAELADHSDTATDVAMGAMRHVFDTLTTGGRWHPVDRKPEGPVFFYMREAENMYLGLSAKARRLITGGFSPCWSSDGTKVAYCQGLPGYSGIAVYNLESQETTLLVVPGRDPSWSPDGRHIAFVRDAPALRLTDLKTRRAKGFTGSYRKAQEVWIMKADGSEPRCLTRGLQLRGAHCPSWSADAKSVYYQNNYDKSLSAISIEVPQAEPMRIADCFSWHPVVSPQGSYVADLDGGREKGAVLRIIDVAAQSCITEWPTPLVSPTAFWSPDECELSLGGLNGIRERTGLWIYDLAKREGVKVLSGHFGGASWSPDRTRLLISLSEPYWEIWVAELDPNLSTAESLGRVQTLEEHCLEAMTTCTRDLEVAPGSFVDQWTRTVSALWIGHPKAPEYLRTLDLRLRRPPVRASHLNRNAAQNILKYSTLYERLGDLAWVLARRAVEQQPDHAQELVPLFERIGENQHAARLLNLAQTDTARGSSQRNGSSTHCTVIGSGTGIGGPADELHFVYQHLGGDGSLTAKIESFEAGQPAAMAGVMMRAGMDPDAAFAGVFVMPGGGVSYHARAVPGAVATADDGPAPPTHRAPQIPMWLRLERQGDRFSASYSPDGATWVPIASVPREIIMPYRVYIGPAVASGDNTRTAEAHFAYLTATGDVNYQHHFLGSQDIRPEPSPPDR
jgi:serine/threonine protein kinase